MVEAGVRAGPEKRHGRLFRRVTAIWRSGQHSRAIAILRALRRRHPNDSEVLAELAWTLNFSGRLEEAAEAMVEYAKSCQQRGALAEAVGIAEFALRLDRNRRSEAWAVRGQVFAALGCPEEAWESLEAAYESAYKELCGHTERGNGPT